MRLWKRLCRLRSAHCPPAASDATAAKPLATSAALAAAATATQPSAAASALAAAAAKHSPTTAFAIDTMEYVPCREN